MPYATVDEFLERYDVRDIGDLISDNNAQVTEELCRTNKKLLAALNDASGEIDSAVLVGERYTPTNLRNLTANSAFTLVRITCDIAIARLMQRRPGRAIEQTKAMLEAAMASLDMLRQGQAVFETTTNGDAGQPSLTTITYAEIENLNLLRDRCTGYYPQRHLPTNRRR